MRPIRYKIGGMGRFRVVRWTLLQIVIQPNAAKQQNKLSVYGISFLSFSFLGGRWRMKKFSYETKAKPIISQLTTILNCLHNEDCMWSLREVHDQQVQNRKVFWQNKKRNSAHPKMKNITIKKETSNSTLKSLGVLETTGSALPAICNIPLS